MFKKIFLLCGIASILTFANAEKKETHKKESATAKPATPPEKAGTIAKSSTSQDCSKLPQEKKVELWNKANCFFKKKEHLSAIDTFRRIYTEYPEEMEAFFLSSYSYWELGLANEAQKREEYYKASLEELEKATAQNPDHWRPFIELGDHYAVRELKPEKAQSYYLSARKLYVGNAKKGIPEASEGQKSSIEDRIARNSEALDRRGDAVSATCLSLYYDPDNEEAQGRLNRLGGACKRKNFRPKSTEGEATGGEHGAEHGKEEHH